MSLRTVTDEEICEFYIEELRKAYEGVANVLEQAKENGFIISFAAGPDEKGKYGIRRYEVMKVIANG